MAADDHRPPGRPEDLYEQDFYLWTQVQAEALRAEARRGGGNAVDWERVAEEIEDMGGRDVRECYSRVATIIEHLFKLAWTQREEPKAGWRLTIAIQRRDIEFALTASIRRKVEEKLGDLHRSSVALAVRSFEIEEPSAPTEPSLRWSLPQILGEEDDPIA